MNSKRAMDKDLEKKNPYPTLVKYSPDVPKKKTKVLDMYYKN